MRKLRPASQLQSLQAFGLLMDLEKDAETADLPFLPKHTLEMLC